MNKRILMFLKKILLLHSNALMVNQLMYFNTIAKNNNNKANRGKDD